MKTVILLEKIRDKEIVVYGTGSFAAKCIYYLEQNGVSVEFMIDDDGDYGDFANYKVYAPKRELLQGKYIIAACPPRIYPKIRERLVQMEKAEFEDFIYFNYLDKKLVFIFGNCHMDIVESYLQSSRQFQEDYIVYFVPRIFEKPVIDKEIMQYMDIWVHQDIRPDNGYGYQYSDEYMKHNVHNVIEIVVPNLFGYGAAFFPYAKQENPNNCALLNGKDKNGMFPYRDYVIENCLRRKMSVNQICQYVEQDNIIPRKEIEDNFHEYILKMREREKAWDIKVVDFILDNYKQEKLFYDAGHPANAVLKMISKGILEILGITEEVYTEKCLDSHEIPVYSWVKKVLGLAWEEDEIRVKSEKRAAASMDVEEYVREYIWWCWRDSYER